VENADGSGGVQLTNDPGEDMAPAWSLWPHLRVAGAAYLVWLGIKALRSHFGPLTRAPLDRASEWAIFRQGMITNLLNPKVALFFLAFLPQFTSPASGSVPMQIIVLGCLFNISGTLVNIAVARLAASARRWLAAGQRGERVLRWITGSVFIGLGLRLALGERR
jgi:threonine/homoserine/homoserine lactone efflux protein